MYMYVLDLWLRIRNSTLLRGIAEHFESTWIAVNEPMCVILNLFYHSLYLWHHCMLSLN